ncbi:hypothetical protein N7492_009886 [Penicillium capsulatum]|uniref:Rhodopsin domain-containing protein n=1 Tax=Penicillium capsulatum TaxID=69766 RepID=A0A9W9HNI1_9EURO|nr:hypothetical protein N7492_009886 [Penicillium capsulatum]KAJ6112397.1 hypothetical protein N7512_007721 [Penicillium capsulatum]
MSVHAGLGAHKSELSHSEITAAIKWSWINQIFAILATVTGKLAVVAFLQQIHGPEHRRRVLLLWGLIASNVVINCITITVILIQCSPLAKLWDERVVGVCNGRGRNQEVAYMQGSWSALCDLILALYPVVFFWNVRLKLRVKFGLCFLMGLGVIACGCSIIKTTFLRVLSETKDVTFHIAQLVLWNETEKWVVLMVGCIPPIRPLLMMVVRILVNSTQRGVGTTAKEPSNPLYAYYGNKDQSPKPKKATSGLISMLTGKGSDENILTVEEGGIVKTTDISLSYDRASESREATSHGQVLPNDI